MSAKVIVKTTPNQLREQLSNLRDEQKKLLSEVRQEEKISQEFRTNRDKLNDSLREMMKKSRMEREERDKINVDVQFSKEMRKISNENFDKAKEKLDKAFTEINALTENSKSKVAGSNERRLRYTQEKAKQIELKLETQGNLEPEEEEKYIKELEELHKKFSELNKIEQKYEEVREIRRKLHVHRSNAREHAKKVKEFAEVSQKHHDTMLEIMKNGKVQKEEADKLHKLRVEYLIKVKAIREKIRKTIEKADEIRKKLGEETTVERNKRRKEEEVIAKIAETKRNKILKQKLDAGAKLGFEEFRILASKGLVIKNKKNA